MKKSFFIMFLLCASFINAQPMYIQWQKSLAGSMDDEGNAVKPTADGGYIVVGTSASNNGDVTGNHGSSDYWVVKLDNFGTIQWTKSLGGSGTDAAKSIQQTMDGGYVIAGTSASNNGDVTGNHGGNDGWIVKLDNTGIVEWQKSIGGSSDDNIEVVQQTTDGGYIVAGDTRSNNGDVTGGPVGNNHCWIVKLDSTGIIQWQNPLGGTSDDYTYDVQQTTDGGYIAAGGTNSNNGDVTGNHGFTDFWVFKLDSSGILQWQKTLGGVNWDYATAIRQTAEGGYIVTGISDSNTGDVTINHGGYDAWIVKLNSSGVLEWEKSLGGSGTESGQSIYQTSDKGYIFAGSSDSNDGDVIGNHGSGDYWIVKMDSLGTIEWKKSLGGTNSDYLRALQPLMGGGCIMAGASNSNDGDVTGNHGAYDYWVVKLDTTYASAGVEESENNPSIIISPNPNNGQFYITNNFERESNISIYDITGKLVYQTTVKINNQLIDLSGKEKGIYFYRINTSEKIISKGPLVLQ